MQDFRQLKVWEKSHQLTLAIYAAAKGFPTDERYGVTSQMRRAAASVPTNIAEGCGRGSDADFARFIQIALGSASELEYLVILARDLSYLSPEQAGSFETAIQEVKRMLTGLIKTLKA